MANITRWNAGDYIGDEQDAIAYLNAVAELDDPNLMQTRSGGRYHRIIR